MSYYYDNQSFYIFLEFTNQNGDTVRGSSIKKGFEDKIEILNWNHNVKRSNKDEAETAPEIFFFSKYIDRASKTMMEMYRKGENIKEMKLYCYTLEKGEKPETHLIVTLHDLYIDEISISAAENSPIYENLSITFNNIDYDFRY